MIFFMVLVSMVVQGTTIMPLARALKLDKPYSGKERLPLELEATPASSGHEMKEFTVPADADYAGKTIADLDLPSAPKKFLNYFEDPARPQTRLDRDLEGGMASTFFTMIFAAPPPTKALISFLPERSKAFSAPESISSSPTQTPSTLICA